MPTLPPMLRTILIIAEALLFFAIGMAANAAVLIGMKSSANGTD